MKGTHGTCRSAADEIVLNGFKKSDGRGGTGVYFWAYVSEKLKGHAGNLAIDWWDFNCARNAYVSYRNKACSVIYATFNVSPDNRLSFVNQESRERFLEYAVKLALRLKQDSRTYRAPTKIQSVVYDSYLLMLEREGCSYKVIEMLVPPPRKIKWRKVHKEESLLVGHPLCYVVRDVNVINCIDKKDFDSSQLESRARIGS